MLSMDKKKYLYQLHMMWQKYIIIVELILGWWKIVKSYVDGLPT